MEDLRKSAIPEAEIRRAHSDTAEQYAQLKYQLAELYRFDREAYTEAKTSFVTGIVALALAEGQ